MGSYSHFHQLMYDAKKEWLKRKGYTRSKRLTKEEEKELENYLQEFRRQKGLR